MRTTGAFGALFLATAVASTASPARAGGAEVFVGAGVRERVLTEGLEVTEGLVTRIRSVNSRKEIDPRH